MIWPFKRKPAPLNPGPINEDWTVGDLAECLSANWTDDNTGAPTPGPEIGDVLRVTGIVTQRTRRCGDGWYLTFKSISLGDYFQASAFRKVSQLSSECDADFAEQIKRLKPAHNISLEGRG